VTCKTCSYLKRSRHAPGVAGVRLRTAVQRRGFVKPSVFLHTVLLERLEKKQLGLFFFFLSRI